MIVIVAGGNPPGEDALRESTRNARTVIAADLGAQYCLSACIRPDLIVGDMDSIKPDALEQLRSHGIPILTFKPDKDKTDTQIALEEALKYDDKEIEIFSGTGTRFDHSLANMHLLYFAHKAGVRVRLITEHQSIFLVEGDYLLDGEMGSTISFLPLGMQSSGITLKGFAFEISEADMELGTPYGVSNIVTDNHAQITVRQGILVTVLTRINVGGR